ncbi:vacJ like lipofamily protein [Collimonas arenae]|uniref:VacJ like lipofamily protein n=1 Tax=Collimonas arenae TaxID=279058 RepID=A0A127QE53_9BURK|nr:VacJ family lipoprotein [Collimonas arenae]AMO98405.1 vacJ like lipofamily protein [Collimonas arenae]AMP08286.1 vacJ like lipofamily protein [Collimonas arenae]
MKMTMRLGSLAMVAALSGCATTGNTSNSNPQDPLEGFNRAMFSFNDTLDKVALKPVATAYRSWLPSFVQTGIHNFFGNIGDVWSSVNGFLQGNVADGTSDVMRVAVNSTLGLGGLLDISSEAGLQKHNKDFGQTLGKWGIGSGPYLVLPLFGPSNIRDTAALPVDFYGDLWSYKYPVRWRNTGSVVRLIDKRANLLDAGDLLEDAALDKYQFVRDAYTQRRQSQIKGDDDSDATDKPGKTKSDE